MNKYDNGINSTYEEPVKKEGPSSIGIGIVYLILVALVGLIAYLERAIY